MNDITNIGKIPKTNTWYLVSCLFHARLGNKTVVNLSDRWRCMSIEVSIEQIRVRMLEIFFVNTRRSMFDLKISNTFSNSSLFGWHFYMSIEQAESQTHSFFIETP